MRERQERRHLPVLGVVHTCTIGQTKALRGAWSVVTAELKPTGHMATTATTFAVALGTHVARLRELRQNVMWLRLSLATQHYQHRKISCAHASVLDSQMFLLLLLLRLTTGAAAACHEDRSCFKLSMYFYLHFD